MQKSFAQRRGRAPFFQFISLICAALGLWGTVAHAQVEASVPADGVTASGTQVFASNFACNDDISRASDGSTARTEALCPVPPVNPAYEFALAFSPARPQFLTGVRVWANGGNIYSDAELRQFDIEVDHFNPVTGLTETFTLGDQNIGDTRNDSDPKTVSFGALYAITEVRISDLRGVPSGTTGRPAFREIQGLFQVLPIAPEINLTSSVNGDIADGGTDAQGTQQAGVAQTVTYTIRNQGTDTLTFSGTPSVTAVTNIDGVVIVGAPSSSSLEPGETTTFDVTFTPAADGPFSFDVAVASDDADEASYDVTISGRSNEAPSATITGPSEPQSGPFTVTVTFTEDVTGLDLGDFVVTNGTASDLVPDATGQVYTVLITPTTPGADVTVALVSGAAVDAEGAASEATAAFAVGTGALTPEVRDDIRDIIIEEAVRATQRDILTNQRAMRSARDRFATERRCRRQNVERQITNDHVDCLDVNADVPLSFDGTLQATQNATSAIGSFFGQSTDVTGKRRLVFGEFDVTRYQDDDVTASLTGRVAWEKLISETTMLGYFVGASASQSTITGSFAGQNKAYGLNAGAYFVDELDQNLVWDGFIAVGIGQNDLELTDGTFDVGSDYRTRSLVAGLALSGEKDFEDFVLRPELSIAYGVTRIGEVDLNVMTATSDLTDVVDAGDVSVGTLRFTPELLVPLHITGEAYDAVELRIAPSLVCEVVRTTSRSSDCGGGFELEWSSFSDDRTQEFSARVSREVIGASSRSSFGIEARYNF